MQPKDISVLLSVHNAERTLDKTLRSLFDQTFSNFVVVAVDDASTDNSQSILKDWERKVGQNRIKLLVNKKNLGLTKSLNFGLRHIESPFTARIDADDWWSSTKLEKQHQFMAKHPDYGVVGTNYVNVGKDKEVQCRLPNTDEEIKKDIFRRNPFAHSAVLFNTKLVKSAGGYDETVYFGQDYELWLRLLPKTKFYNLSEILCFRAVENTLSTNNRQPQMLSAFRTRLMYLHKYKRPLWDYRYLIDLILIAYLPNWIRKLKSS